MQNDLDTATLSVKQEGQLIKDIKALQASKKFIP